MGKYLSILDFYKTRLTLEGIRQKKLHEGISGGGGGQSDSSTLLLAPFIRLTRYLAHIMNVLCSFN